VLRHYQDLPFAEIATILGIREDAARANHYQG
jgi:DNA-directed RNA polymerase specialized sigma24 family protein